MHHTWPFSLEAQFLGFSDCDRKRKYLKLLLPNAESGRGLGCTTPFNFQNLVTIEVKVPKESRLTLAMALRSGDHVKVEGFAKFDPAAKELKLKARQIIPLNAATQIAPFCPLPAALPSQRKSEHNSTKAKILICQKSGCRKRGGQELRQRLEKALMERNWHDKVVLETTGCLKQCSKAPNFTIRPGKQCYNRLHSGVFNHLGSVLETTKY
jgi:hypothetical protein